MRLKDRVIHITPSLVLQTLRLLAVIPLGGTIILSVYSSYSFLFMSPHYGNGKPGAGNFNWVSPKGSLGPLTRLLISGRHLLKCSPGFTRGRSMNFTSLACPLSESLESHGSPVLPKHSLRLKQVTDGGKHQSCAGTCRGWNAQPRLTRLLVPLTPSSADGHLLSLLRRGQRHPAAQRATPPGQPQTPFLSSGPCPGTRTPL